MEGEGEPHEMVNTLAAKWPENLKLRLKLSSDLQAQVVARTSTHKYAHK